MKINAALFIALRYLWTRAGEGVRYLKGAAAGIAISLIPIIITLIVADGMIMGITDRYIELGTGHLQVFDLTSYNNTEDTVNKLNDIDGVKGTWPEQRGIGVIAGKSGRKGVTVRSIESSFWDDPGAAGLLTVIDGVNKPVTERDIVLGETLAEAIGVRVGDTVRLMTLRTLDSGRLTPRNASFTVSGILSCGYNELDALWCITSWEGGRRLLSIEQSSTSYIIKINNPYEKADDFAWKLYQQLGSGYSVYTWKDLLRSQYSSYETTRQLLLFIMALIVIVAAVNVSSATNMLVMERKRDIAVLKVSGAGVRGVTSVFLLGSFLTGFIGGIIGITLGLFLGSNINFIIRSLERILSFFSHFFNGSDIKILDPGFYLETIPIIIDWSAVLMIWIFTILCSVAASMIPARRAGKLKPMDLLRKI